MSTTPQEPGTAPSELTDFAKFVDQASGGSLPIWLWLARFETALAAAPQSSPLDGQPSCK